MFAKNLKFLRKSKGFTQLDLAKILNTSASTIGMYEQGRRAPDNNMLKKLSNIFCISIDDLLGNFSQHKEIKDVIEDMTNFLKEHKALMFNGRPASTLEKIKLANAIKVAAAVTVYESQNEKCFDADFFKVLQIN